MKTKEEIVKDWLPRYTGVPLENFGEYILLTNFSNYVEMFAKWHKVKVIGKVKMRQGLQFAQDGPNRRRIGAHQLERQGDELIVALGYIV